MNLLLALIGCDRRNEPTDDGTAPPPVCGAVNDTQVSVGQWTSVTSPGCGSLELGNFRVLGDGTFAVDLFSDGERVIPHVVAETDGVFRGLHLSGTFTLDGEQPARLWRQAFASGSSAIEELPETVALDVDGVPILVDEPAGTSAWAGLVGRHDGASAIVGVHSTVLTRFAAALAADGTVHAVWGGQGEELPLAAGNELFLDPLFLAMGRDPNALWETWVAAVAENAALVPLGPPQPTVTIPLGGVLGSSYVGYVVSEFAEWADSHPEYAALHAVLVEEWEGAPSTTAELAETIRSAGIVPALRLAPFVAAPDDETVSLHPDWWVRDQAGDLVLHDGFAALDVTRLDAANEAGDVLERLAAEGWQLLVLDHLEAAAVEGVRSEGGTGTLAYRSALDLVRASAPGVSLVGVDAPLLPSVGLLDGFRIAQKDHELPGRVFTGGVWWWIDAGRVPADDDVEPNPVTGEVVHALLAGGSWTVGFIPSTDSLLTTMLDLASLGAAGSVPLEPLLTLGPPPRWTFETREIALVNWSWTPVTIPGPGGTEMLSGETAAPGDRVLEPLAAEIWIPAEE